MLSKRQFFSIFLLFMALFVLFVGPEVVKQATGDYNRNESAEEKSSLTEEDVADPDQESERLVVYIGDSASETFQTCQSWALYTKRDLKTYRTLSDELAETLADAKGGGSGQETDLVCVDKTALETDVCENIRKVLKAGVRMAFVSLPDAEELAQDEELQDILGISDIRQNKIRADGVHLYKGLLLGGERIYQATTKEEEKLQDLDLSVPWYATEAGSRVYMSAILDGKEYEDLKNQDMPALIWRMRSENAYLYAVSGSFMENKRIGMGLLSGFMADTSDYELYPVVNAQSLVLSGFPALSDENTDTMESVYGYSQKQFQKDIIQPGIWSTVRETGLRPTALILPKYDYSDSADTDSSDLAYYLRELREVHGEAGISFDCINAPDFQDVLSLTDLTLPKAAEGYTFGAAFVTDEQQGNITRILKSQSGSSLTTFLTGYDEASPLFSYTDGNCVTQPLLSDASTHTYTEDLELLGDETALGYSTVSIDVTRTLWPEDESDRWENLSRKALGNIATYWKPFETFASTTLSESGKKVRRFLALDFEVSAEKEENGRITLDIQTSSFEEEASYLLRLHDREVLKVTGGSVREVEEGVYLLTLTKEDAKAVLSAPEDATSG